MLNYNSKMGHWRLGEAGLTISEVDDAAGDWHTSPLGQTAADRQWLDRITDRRWADLPDKYLWLRDWETV